VGGKKEKKGDEGKVGSKEEWMDGWMDGWMVGWMDGWKDVKLLAIYLLQSFSNDRSFFRYIFY